MVVTKDVFPVENPRCLPRLLLVNTGETTDGIGRGNCGGSASNVGSGCSCCCCCR